MKYNSPLFKTILIILIFFFAFLSFLVLKPKKNSPVPPPKIENTNSQRPPPSSSIGATKTFNSPTSPYQINIELLTGLTNNNHCEFTLLKNRQPIVITNSPAYISCQFDIQEKYGFKQWLHNTMVIENTPGIIELIDVEKD